MKTTHKQFEMFKKECQKWVNRFGIFGWRFYYIHENYDDSGDRIAYIVWPNNIEDRVFTVGLSVDISDITDRDIRCSAFHEVMEAFLYRLQVLAKSRTTFDSDVTEEIHHLIRTLETVIFDYETK
jgi:hypothetical protein